MKTNRPSEKNLRKQLKRWKQSSDSVERAATDRPQDSDFEETVIDQKIDYLDMEVQDLLDEVDQRGDNLVNSPTVKNIRRYKQALASFLKKSLKLSKEIERLQGKRGNVMEQLKEDEREKEHVIVNTIDEELDELTTELLENESENVNLTEKVGEIKGLVVDLVNSIENKKP